MIASDEVFNFADRNYQNHTMPLRLYVLAIAVLVAGGLGLAGYFASLTYEMKPDGWWLIGYLAISLPGIYLSAKSDNWLVSLLGYLMVIFATGALCGPYVALYKLDSVVQILMITIGVTVVLGVSGAIYPKSVEHWGGFLLTALLVVIFINIGHIFMIGFGLKPIGMRLVDWLATFLFCGFIFYDMNRATRMAYTMDNAVDSAVALYLDVINLFIRLLSLLGQRKD